MKKYSVEIVIPIYNEEEELEKNITKLHSFAVKNLTLYDWHITIADNASTDKSLAIAQKISKEKSHLGFVHLDQKGRGRAVKKAWKQNIADIRLVF